MPIERITADDLRDMEHQEGLVLQGCGGEAQEWLDGINALLTQDGILQNGSRFETAKVFQHDGLTDLLFPFENIQVDSGIPQEALNKEKAEVYEQLSEVNRKIRAEREKWKLCRDICRQTPVMEQDIQKTEEHQKEVREHEHRRR